MEEVRHEPSERILREHYVIVVDFRGKMRTFYPNQYESYRWTLDLRRTFDWQQTRVKDCSTIRSNTMATVNAAFRAQYGLVVLIWDTETGNLTDLIDSIPDVIQARWCPPQKHREFILMISSKEMITAYNADDKNFLWAIMEPEMKLYTNLFTAIAYAHKNGKFIVANFYHFHLAYVLNQRDGSVIKRMGFTHDQLQVVATGSASNIRLSALGKSVS
jgi:hypothetical protein